MNSKIAIIMCVWQRLHTLEKTLGMLENQTDKQFEFFIWNNNPNIKEIKNLINPKKYNFKISSINYNQNIGGIGRFYYANYISEDFDYIIFIDDDQEFDKNLVETLREEAKPDTISGWWAWRTQNEYFNRKPLSPGEEGDYVGTGGMVCPSKIFKDTRLFENLPKKYLFLEDLWLSYFSQKYLNFKLKKSKVNIQFIPGEIIRDQSHNLGELKKEFYNFLKNE